MATPVYRLSRSSDIVRVSSDGGGEIALYQFRLMRMIPAETVSLYLIGEGIIPKDQRVALMAWSAICLLGVFLIRVVGTRDPEQGHGPDWVHVMISTVAFVIWVYTLGGVFGDYKFYVPWIGSLALLAWTFFTPLLYRGPDDD